MADRRVSETLARAAKISRAGRGRGAALHGLLREAEWLTEDETDALAKSSAADWDEIRAEYVRLGGDPAGFTLHALMILHGDADATRIRTLAMLEDMAERIVGLERQLADRTAPTVTYCGVFRDGQQYQRGNMATLDGSIWHANETTSERPGKSGAWTLAVKRGANGKDARA